MSRLSIITTTAALFAMLALTAGCSSEICALDSTINPGAGVDLQGRTLCLGGRADEVQSTLGSGATRQDLGAVGVRVDHPDHAVTLLFSGPADTDLLRAVTLHPGAGVRTAGGLTHGSGQAAARAELGEPSVEPMLGAWIYNELGLTLIWRLGQLDRIQLTAPVVQP